MAEQSAFLFDAAAPLAEQPQTYPAEVAFRLLAMMSGEAMYYIEEIVTKADAAGAADIKTLAARAMARLNDEPSRAFVTAASLHVRARALAKDCDYG